MINPLFNLLIIPLNYTSCISIIYSYLSVVLGFFFVSGDGCCVSVHVPCACRIQPCPGKWSRHEGG